MPRQFSHAEGKNSLVTCLFNFVPSATMVALQSDCFIRMMSCTALNGNQRSLGGWSPMQATKPGRSREQPAKEFHDLCILWKDSVCFWTWKLAVWSSWASNVNKIFSGLSEVDRSFMFCEFSFLGVWKLQEGWFLQWAVSLELFCSFKLCVTSHNTFLKILRHQFFNRMKPKLNRQLTRLFSSSTCEK